MKVILGLGNPGLKYRFSRHNLGFLVVKKLAGYKKIKVSKKAFHCLSGKGMVENQEVLLGFPLTFMNLSGEAVAPIVKSKEIKLADLLIVCDDVNLPLGKIRIRAKGSHGGHKGLGSITETLGSDHFPRLRIGVGRPQTKPEKVQLRQRSMLSRYVLGSFNKKEIKIINEAIEKAVSACLVWIKEGIQAAMNKFNK